MKGQIYKTKKNVQGLKFKKKVKLLLYIIKKFELISKKFKNKSSIHL